MTANLHHPSDAPQRERRTRTDDVEPHARSSQRPADPADPPVEELLALFGDEYARALLRALEDGPEVASTLAEQCEMSRQTVYRRLDRLTDAGVVDSRMRLHPDGHHRQEYHLVLDEFVFEVTEDGLDGTVQVAAPAGD